jgi:hypothetical protein
MYTVFYKYGEETHEIVTNRRETVIMVKFFLKDKCEFFFVYQHGCEIEI